MENDADFALAAHGDLTEGCGCDPCRETRLTVLQARVIRKLRRQLREAQAESDRWRAEYMAAKGETWHV